MAKLLHLSDGYLQDLYKRAFGVSCLEDVIACRINMARDLLLHSDMSVREIAEFCGYNNIEHFSRQFRRTVGTSPLGFRRQRFTL